MSYSKEKIIMIKVLNIAFLFFIYSCSSQQTENKEVAKTKDVKNITHDLKTNQIKKEIKKEVKQNDILKEADIDKDEEIDGNDWIKLSKEQKYRLVNYYNNMTNQSLGLKPSKENQEKEIGKMTLKLDNYYKVNDPKNRYQDYVDRNVYEVMTSVK